ncbi:MAG: carbamoyltransferase [Candidatus Theseobacter exili]|nr:carbamoyltransferase [Candidatus Theseobacter exili]
MTTILGISAYYHDSAAVLIQDGIIIAASQEERFTRKKHDSGFPEHAINFCLEKAGIAPEQLDYVGFYDKPFLKFERLLETYLAFAPKGFSSFFKAMPVWLNQKLHLRKELNKGLNHSYKKRYIFAKHHESHAASAFFPSPFEEAAILTLDGVGEWSTATLGHGKQNKITLTDELLFPHSLGLLYSAFTYFCGFKVNSGEYKLMGLAPYGEPEYVDIILKELIDLKEDGSFRMDMSYFNYCQGLTMTSNKFEKLFGPPRKKESPITTREMNLARSIQKVTEEIMLKCIQHIHRQTGLKNLCLAGGVALNCVGNGRILREGPFENIWIQPAAGDAGGALGVAYLIWYQLLNMPRKPDKNDSMKGSFLGPNYTNEEILSFLKKNNAVYHFIENETALCDQVANYISSEKVVGWFQGQMEFGPRALGSRSILGDPRSPKMQSVMNLKIKFRESFRPFAPSVLKEKASDYFQFDSNSNSPYMLLVAPISDKIREQESQGNHGGLDKLKQIRSTLPAITHVDYSARIQTVDPEKHGRYYKLIKSFNDKTGCPVVINTSFNVRGEPIVCSPKHAYRCFMATNMDVLVLEHFILLKEEQKKSDQHANDNYISQFELD